MKKRNHRASELKPPTSIHFHKKNVLTRSSRYFLLVKQQHQSILPAFCRLASIVTIATKAVI